MQQAFLTFSFQFCSFSLVFTVKIEIFGKKTAKICIHSRKWPKYTATTKNGWNMQMHMFYALAYTNPGPNNDYHNKRLKNITQYTKYYF